MSPLHRDRLDPVNRIVMIGQGVTLRVIAGDAAKGPDRPALRQQRQLPPENGRGKSHQKLVATRCEIDDREPIGQGFCESNDVGYKLPRRA